MRRDKEEKIVVVNRKKASFGGSHGGAWKVAYADFVTAMMAFFLLLWLLNASTDSQVSGVAEYFSRSEILISSEFVVSTNPGNSQRQGSSSSTDQLNFDIKNPSVLEMLQLPRNTELGSSNKESEITLQMDDRNIDVVRQTEQEISRKQDIGVPAIVQVADSNSPQQNTLLIETRDDGLFVNVASKQGVFELDSAVLNDIGEGQLANIATLLMANYQDVTMNIIGYTRYAGTEVDSWSLSLERAISVMLWFQRNGFSQEAVLAIDGYGHRHLLDNDSPEAPINDRVLLVFTNINVNDGALN